MFCGKPSAQAGLEYLMTYGWALVLIVTVASALFFVMGTPQNQFVCSSSDPTKILLESYNLPYSPNFSAGGSVPPESSCYPASASKCEVWGNPWASTPDIPGKMVLRNATGGEIKIISLVPWSGSDAITMPGCTYFWCFLGGANPCAVEASALYATFNGIKINLIIPTAPLSVSGGRSIVIDNLVLSKRARPGTTCDPQNFSFPQNPSFVITYLDRSGYQKDVTITCKGYPSKT
ncbi:MAG: hypothetical protein PHD95_02385 [Candidatus ainarchaeum sp.]|nr:hypothetical protein [Candidatus ainarchaeum sp.]